MTITEKLRFIADRMEDGKEFYISDYLFVYRIGLLMMALDETKKDSKFIKSEMTLESIIWLDLKLKPRWEFTEDEKVILRNLPEQYKWIARDEHTNRLTVYEHCPSKYTEASIWRFGGIAYSLSPFKNLFQSIQWSDDEPCEFRKYL